MTTGTHDGAPPTHRVRRLRGSVLVGAVLTGAFVAVGALVTATTLPRFESPEDVTRAYASALYDGDWPRILKLSCKENRAFYAGRESWESPARHEYDIDVGALEVVSDRGEPKLQVPYKQSSNQSGREDDGFETAALVFQEEGQFRICGMALVR